jgi:hypothetical protein
MPVEAEVDGSAGLPKTVLAVTMKPIWHNMNLDQIGIEEGQDAAWKVRGILDLCSGRRYDGELLRSAESDLRRTRKHGYAP